MPTRKTSINTIERRDLERLARLYATSADAARAQGTSTGSLHRMFDDNSVPWPWLRNGKRQHSPDDEPPVKIPTKHPNPHGHTYPNQTPGSVPIGFTVRWIPQGVSGSDL